MHSEGLPCRGHSMNRGVEEGKVGDDGIARSLVLQEQHCA